MKSPRVAAWRYKYLTKVRKYYEDGYLIVYLDETWFVSHDTVRMLSSGPPLRRKRIVKCHAGKSKSFLEYSLLLCGK